VCTKKKDAAATREAILVAARAAFTRLGYDRAGVRQIAAAAGANVALVNRYFGSKERLFDEAVTSTFSVAALLPEGFPPKASTGFPQTFAQHFLARTRRDSKELDSTLAMLRSAGNAQAVELMRIGLEERYIQPLAEWIGGAAPQARAAMFVAVLAGVAVLRDVVGIAPLKDEDTTAKLMARLLEVLVEADA